MILEELLDEFRNQLSDEAQPYLWSDDEVVRYIIDAQDMFARLTGGIADMSTTAIVNVQITLNQPFSDHSPYILRIMSGRLLTSKRDIEFVQESQIPSLRERDYGSYNGFSLDDSDTGEVRYGVLGLTDKKIRWLRVPLISEICRIRVYRLPYPRITALDGGVLEIDVQHHIHLIKWMKHLAYSKQDAETRDDKKAADNKLAFEEYCKAARGEVDRARYKPRYTQYNP